MPQTNLTADLLKLGQAFGGAMQQKYKANEIVMRKNASKLISQSFAKYDEYDEFDTENPAAVTPTMLQRRKEELAKDDPISKLKTRYGSDKDMMSIIESEYEPQFNRRKSNTTQKVNKQYYGLTRDNYLNGRKRKLETSALSMSHKELALEQNTAKVSWEIDDVKDSGLVVDGAITNVTHHALNNEGAVMSEVMNGTFKEYLRDVLFTSGDGITLSKDKKTNEWKIDSNGILTDEDEAKLMTSIKRIEKSFTTKSSGGNLRFKTAVTKMDQISEDNDNGLFVSTEQIKYERDEFNYFKANYEKEGLNVSNMDYLFNKWERNIVNLENTIEGVKTRNTSAEMKTAITSGFEYNGTWVSPAVAKRNLKAIASEKFDAIGTETDPAKKKNLIVEYGEMYASGIQLGKLDSIINYAKSGATSISPEALGAGLEIINYLSSNTKYEKDFGLWSHPDVRREASEILADEKKDRGQKDNAVKSILVTRDAIFNASISPMYKKTLGSEEIVDKIEGNMTQWLSQDIELSKQVDINMLMVEISSRAKELTMSDKQLYDAIMANDPRIMSVFSKENFVTGFFEDKDYRKMSTGTGAGESSVSESDMRNAVNIGLAQFSAKLGRKVDRDSIVVNVGYLNKNNRVEEYSNSNHTMEIKLINKSTNEVQDIIQLYSDDVMSINLEDEYSQDDWMKIMKSTDGRYKYLSHTNIIKKALSEGK